MTGVERCFQYCEDVESGKIRTNKYIKLAVKRFRNDLKKAEKKNSTYYFDEAAANKFCSFCECLKMYKDKFKGKPLILEPWQCFIFCNIYGWKERATGQRRFKIAFCFVARKNGKALALDTPIYTPSGWRTMGDIHSGDYVYGDDGKPTKVLWESEIHHNHDCYKLTFSNGDEIVADADHLWTVRRSGIKRTYNTETLYNLKSGWSDNSYRNCPFRVPKAKPLQGVERDDLFRSPYTLGFWLGDGTSEGSQVSVGKQDIEAVREILSSEVITNLYKSSSKSAISVNW